MFGLIILLFGQKGCFGMPDSELSIHDLVLEDLPFQFVAAIVEQAPLVYGNAHSRSYAEPAYDKAEGDYTFGHNRRAGFEAMFRREAVKAGLPATVEYTEVSKTPYTLVRAGRFLLTESHVQCKGDIPPAASFRNQHATINHLLMKPRLPFPEFDPLKLLKLSEANGIYGIVSHGSASDDAKTPSFMRLVFPSKDCMSLVENIDLFALRQKMLVKAKAIAATEIAVDVAMPTVKRKGEDK